MLWKNIDIYVDVGGNFDSESLIRYKDEEGDGDDYYQLNCTVGMYLNSLIETENFLFLFVLS